MRANLIFKKTVAKDTKLFTFQPQKNISFKAGDFIYLTLPKLNYPDPRGKTRQFTVASSPTEDNITIVTRMRSHSGFKNTLDELEMGSQIDIDGPMGILHLKDDDTGPHVFIAGGIGITPFRSRLRYLSDKNISMPIQLVYSNTNEEDIAFKKEFDAITKKNPQFKVDYIVSSRDGRLDEQKLAKYKIDNAKYWICGAPSFVDAMEKLVKNIGINGKNIITEKYTGY